MQRHKQTHQLIPDYLIDIEPEYKSNTQKNIKDSRMPFVPASCPSSLSSAHSEGRGTFAKMGTFVPRGMVFIY